MDSGRKEKAPLGRMQYLHQAWEGTKVCRFCGKPENQWRLEEECVEKLEIRKGQIAILLFKRHIRLEGFHSLAPNDFKRHRENVAKEIGVHPEELKMLINPLALAVLHEAIQS